jgi:hypothetical protein
MVMGRRLETRSRRDPLAPEGSWTKAGMMEEIGSTRSSKIAAMALSHLEVEVELELALRGSLRWRSGGMRGQG